jgi:quinoprotein glucose dehydrogenase
LGLAYVPLGNPTPDSFGMERRPFDEKYGSSLVALDAATGRPRWHFQTVHHDLWDQDIPAQPTLIDLPTAKGRVPALLQPTKRGELFVLNRETGQPVFPVEERPAPQKGAVPEEHLSPTQPYQTGVPSFAGPNLQESSMWGITAIDQMMCRIKFRESRYEGPSTPPGLTHAIVMPGSIGGMEWGGVAVDTTRNIAIVNSMIMPNRTLLVPRADAEKQGITRMDNRDKKFQELLVTVGLAQEQTPYALVLGPFLSPLFVPCNQPPFGKLSAVDLTTGKLIWTQPFGTARELGPMGLRSHLPLTIGTPNMGGAVATQTGVFFIAAAQDRRFRAYETATGKELWSVPLPGGGVATPMTYRSPASGRQFVALAVGHDGVRATAGNYIMAYALPKTAGK